jgi:hypothetical protein
MSLQQDKETDWEAYYQRQAEYREQWLQEFRDKFPDGGYVVAQHEQNLTSDSYFSETIFDVGKREFVHVSTGATAYGCPMYTSGLPWLDSASDEIKQLVVETIATKQRQEILEQLESAVQVELDSYLERCALPIIGDKVAVKWKTKGYLKGTVGLVFWKGEDKFSGGVRYGITLESGEKIFVNWKSLVMVEKGAMHNDPPPYEVDVEKIRKYAEERYQKIIEGGYGSRFGSFGAHYRTMSMAGVAQQSWMDFCKVVS